jgi:hypothetical protein
MRLITILTLSGIALVPFGSPVVWLNVCAILAGAGCGLWRFWYEEKEFVTLFPRIVAQAGSDSEDDYFEWNKAA